MKPRSGDERRLQKVAQMSETARGNASHARLHQTNHTMGITNGVAQNGKNVLPKQEE